MSVRPRPITATVTKPKWMSEPPAYMRPSFDYESSGSTASLVSVLDHDSYESDFEEEEIQLKEVKNKKNTTTKRKTKRKTVKSSQDYMYVEEKTTNSKQNDFENSEDDEPKLSPWEIWLIEKTKAERIRQEIDRKKKKELKAKRQEEELKKIQNIEKAEEKRKEWQEHKNKQQQAKLQAEKQRVRMEKSLKIEEQRKIQEKSVEKYNEWILDKKHAERAKKKQDREKRKSEELKDKERKEKAEKVFKDWCKKAAGRPKTAPSSIGYSSGRLKDYYDQNAYPAPSYVNEIPWCHPPIPKQKQKTAKKISKPAAKYQWNPNKYL